MPVPIVECPAHVTVLRYGYAAFWNHAPSRINRFNPALKWSA